MKLLFVKQSQSWPRSSGHDVHGYHMMRALAARGHAISLATIVPPEPKALDGLKLESPVYRLAETRTPRSGARKWTKWHRRFTNYFGIQYEWADALAEILEQNHFDVVIVVARHLLPLLSVIKSPIRIWYPADDPAWHHLTRIKPLQPNTWSEAKRALINGLYEWSFRRSFDRVWVVSPPDRSAMHFITACRNVDLVANGVDAEHYRPMSAETIPFSCVFWGRLDFGPNVDALQWFVRSIWPDVRAKQPAATFHVFGFNPTPAVRELLKAPGIELHPDLPDLRAEVARRQVVVLPFISGGGIKNKLLEAAAMGRPVVCTQQGLSGTKGNPPVRCALSPWYWSKALGELWASAEARESLGRAARQWVIENHTWEAAAKVAEEGLRESMRRGE